MNSNKKILLLIDTLQSGGAERQICNLAIGLKRYGFQVYLVKFHADEIFYKDILDRAGIEVSVCTQGCSALKRPFALKSLIAKINPLFVVAYKNGTCMGACLARMICNFRLIVSERNTTQQLTFRERAKFFLYRWADVIVPNSYSQARFLEEHYPVLSSKIKVITNVIDTIQFFPKNQQCVCKDSMHIITVARIMPQKNILRYLQAVAIVKQKGLSVHFDWYGATLEGDEYAKQVQWMVKDLHLKDTITFHAPSEDIVSCYQKSDIFCLPSLYEGFPNVLCEAMACGLPVVCSRVSDNPDIVEEGINGYLCDPMSAQDIADKLLLAISLSAQQYQRISQNNRKRIETLCSEEVFIQKYLQIGKIDKR